MMSWLRPHWKAGGGGGGVLVVKRQSILVYGSGKNTRGWDPKSVK